MKKIQIFKNNENRFIIAIVMICAKYFFNKNAKLRCLRKCFALYFEIRTIVLQFIHQLIILYNFYLFN